VQVIFASDLGVCYPNSTCVCEILCSTFFLCCHLFLNLDINLAA